MGRRSHRESQGVGTTRQEGPEQAGLAGSAVAGVRVKTGAKGT